MKRFRQKGSHTWDRHLNYHRCPECGQIIESREEYQYIMGTYEKQLACPRCQHEFRVKKNKQSTFGPIFG